MSNRSKISDGSRPRVLITGGTGFIGRYVVRRLLQDGTRPTITTFSRKPLPEDLAAAVDLIEMDVTDLVQVAAVVKSYRPEIVIHLAGVTGHDDPMGEACESVNYAGTTNLLWALDKYGVDRLILLGSAAEYGGHSSPLREDMALRPVTPYGVSKAKACDAALDLHAATGFPVTVLRAFSAFGAGQPKQMFLSQLISHASENRPFRMSDGLQKRDYVYAGDLAEAIHAAISAKNVCGRTINIASGKGTRLRDIALAAWDICHADGRLLEFGAVSKTGDDGFDTEADISLAESLLGWRPSHSILPTAGRHFALPKVIPQIKPRSYAARG